jgi:hypothetical protein
MFKFNGTIKEWRGHQAMLAKSIENVESLEIKRFLLLQKWAIKRDREIKKRNETIKR